MLCLYYGMNVHLRDLFFLSKTNRSFHLGHYCQLILVTMVTAPATKLYSKWGKGLYVTCTEIAQAFFNVNDAIIRSTLLHYPAANKRLVFIIMALPQSRVTRIPHHTHSSKSALVTCQHTHRL